MNWEDLQKANEMIKTISIEKKNRKTGETTASDYAEVNQRIKAFRSVFPMGCISTEMIYREHGTVVFKASIMDDNGKLLGTGTAQEKEDSSFINQTSYIENCETSAVGRALGMCGFGVDRSVASYEEVKNAMLNQNDVQESKKDARKPANTYKLIDKDQADIIRKAYEGNEEKLQKFLENRSVTKLEMLRWDHAQALIDRLEGRS